MVISFVSSLGEGITRALERQKLTVLIENCAVIWRQTEKRKFEPQRYDLITEEFGQSVLGKKANRRVAINEWVVEKIFITNLLENFLELLLHL